MIAGKNKHHSSQALASEPDWVALSEDRRVGPVG